MANKVNLLDYEGGEIAIRTSLGDIVEGELCILEGGTIAGILNDIRGTPVDDFRIATTKKFVYTLRVNSPVSKIIMLERPKNTALSINKHSSFKELINKDE